MSAARDTRGRFASPELARDASGFPLTWRDFGPPRLVHGIDAFEAEIDRQRRLVPIGYLRRWDLRTWGWGPGQMSDGSTRWHWTSQGNYLPCPFDTFADHDRAWSYILANPQRYR